MNVLRKITLLFCVVFSVHAFSYQDSIRIAWDFNQSKFVTSGVYARIKKLQNDELALIYSSGPDVYIRKKNIRDNTWSNAIRVSTDTKSLYNYTNSELLELNDNTLIYAWNARPKIEGQGNPYKIMTKKSKDNGLTWVDEQDVYMAGDVGATGCWEPIFLQLPSGELQIYFANEHVVTGSDQDITLFRSLDNGNTWLPEREVVSYRPKARDGMPVPVYLQNNAGIVCAIEDNGINGRFKPVIVYSSVKDNWTKGPVDGNSTNRWHALAPDYQLPNSVYAGAPYLIQLKNGETLLSVQSAEGRKNPGTHEKAVMKVYIGNETAENFNRPSTPFPFISDDANALWNAVCQISDSSVMAVSSIEGQPSNNGIWTAVGKILNPLESYEKLDEINIPRGTSSAFVGSCSQANMTATTEWDNDNLYFHLNVKDRSIRSEKYGALWDSDGIELYLDPHNISGKTVETGLYKLLVNINSDCLFEKSEGGGWVKWNTEKINYNVMKNAEGYRIDVSIPWAEMEGKPEKPFGIHMKLHNNDIAKSIIHEDLSGGNPNSPLSWLKCTLMTGSSSGIKNPAGPKELYLNIYPSHVLSCGSSFCVEVPSDYMDFSNSQLTIYNAITGQIIYKDERRTGKYEINNLIFRGIGIIRINMGNRQSAYAKFIMK